MIPLTGLAVGNATGRADLVRRNQMKEVGDLVLDCDRRRGQEAFQFHECKGQTIDSAKNAKMQNNNKRMPCAACGRGVLPTGEKTYGSLCKSCFEITTLHQTRLEQIRNILRTALESTESIDYWKQFEAQSLAPIPSPPLLVDLPTKPEFHVMEPTQPTYREHLPENENKCRHDEYLVARERWNSWRLEHEQAVAAWHDGVRKIETENLRRKLAHADALERWKEEQIKLQESIPTAKAGYKIFEPEAVKLYCKLVLQSSNLPSGFRRDFELDYIFKTKVLIVDHHLPSPENLSRIKTVKFVKSKGKYVEVFLTEKEFDETYDSALYQTCLRTISELFHADAANALVAVVFNGWIESVDMATGNDTKGCVLSVHARKEEFQKINLARINPKACFKTLKGVGSSKLHSLTPIAPVLRINREDRRFVASHEVASQLDERFNLAAMDWEDFEHLIRELFEKEFSKSGSEVKVTQASRDGGVDAVVFDPAPIHGGKSVIQAKRYTNTVGVAAVRELYGTVLNEGAMKGILVTTADYGPDAYEFAKGKPLVLLSGANLLHLLEKHGHKAKIDIQEAKRILGEKVQ